MKDSSEWTKFIDKKLDSYDDHPSMCYTGNIYRYFRNFKRVNRSEHGRSAMEFNNILEHKGVKCYILSRNGRFLKCIDYIFEEDFSMEYFVFIQSYKRRRIVMTRCRITEVCERFKLDSGIYDLKSKRVLLRTVEQKGICVRIHKNLYCFIWKVNRRDSLLDGVEEIEKKFKYGRSFLNENILKQRIRYRFPKHETIDQLEKLFVFDLER